MNKLIYTLLIIFLALFSAKGQILINEYSAANYDTYTDNYGEYEDWVELYNSGTTSIDLNGWGLSDKTSNPLKWIFPSSFNIPAGGLAIIYCSGRDEITAGGEAHSNFKITQTKGNEVFMLSNAGGIFQDSIRVLLNQNSHARGRQTNGSAIWSVFTTGTPNISNVGAMQEYATTPVFSQIGGYYSAPVNLTLTSIDPSATIYYTTNGDEPNNTSTVYAGTINITTTTVVKAIAYSSNTNIPASFIEYHTFFINYTHTIPILSISGSQVYNLLDGNGGIEPTGTIEWFDKNGILLDKGTGEYNKHGNDSWAYDQRGFDYIMRDQFGYNYALKDEVFMTKSRGKFQRIIVKAAANDNYPASYGGSGAHIRDAYVHHLSQLSDLRLDERSTTSCILYLNGNYWGVYEIREKVDDSDFLSYYYDQDEISRESAEYIQYLKTWAGTWTKYGDGIPGPASIAENDWDNFVAFVTTNPMTNQINYNTVKSQFNTGSLIDYFLLNSYVVCGDWLNYNTGWWRGLDPNGDKKKWRYTLWDMDNTFDHGWNYTGVPTMSVNADPCDPSSLSDPGGQGHIPIWNELLTNNDFFDDYVNRWQDLATSDLSCANMIAILDSMVAVIEPEMPGQIAKWGGNYTTWESNVQDMEDFILARCSIMNDGFLPCYPALSGPYDVTVEIIGIGEVEMSDNNIINNTNTSQIYSRFGGVSLPFEVTSGSFDHWEVLPTGTYLYDPIVDTLVINLQGDVTVQAYFIPPVPTRDITYNVSPTGTATTINVNGVIINTFPTTVTYTIDELVNISPNLDPLYEFNSWSSDSVILMPIANNPTDSFYASNHDTIILHISKKPTITYVIAPLSTSSTININGVIINTFPATIASPTNATVNISPNLDPLYGFTSWSSNNLMISPSNVSPNAFFDVIASDTVKLNIYKKPTIVYDVVPAGTTTSIDINGVNTSVFPSSATYYNNETITLSPNIGPLYYYISWQYDSIAMLNGNSEVNSFISAYNDTVKLVLNLIPPLEAFIAGNDTICNNDEADVSVSFISASPPYSFVYAINGINQATITTNNNPYNIKTKTEGIYTLSYFSDAINSGSTNGSALVTVLDKPTAIFTTDSDTMSVLYTTLKLQWGDTASNVVNWQWDFGDGNVSSQQHPHHTYQESLGIYQISLVVTDNMGCSDTVIKQIWISDDYWMYIPNAFTPDHDGVNDVFCLEHHGVRDETFTFNIYDRFSNLVYATDKIEKLECLLNSNGWDGKHYETGNDLPMGVYIYEVYFQDFEGWKHQEREQLFIVR